MQMVEVGELALDDPAADHLPADLDFDTNGATIRHLLSQRSGIPDYYPAVETTLSKDPQRVWKPADLLELVSATRTPAGQTFLYGDTNYLLLGLVIEQVRGRPVAEVLRDGVLDVEGVERLIYQPDEVPTEPMAMPYGRSTAELKRGGGYLPSLAGSTSDGPAAAMASDAPSLARWWRAFCAGEIVFQDSLTETFRDEYGLGLFEVADPYAGGVGHTGEHIGYVSWAGCLPEPGAVVVVLHNRVVEDIGGMARPLVTALIESRSD
jgi:D-alanyl-D-alanine carboxypeptidase